ncbi:hypothetical protein DL769_005297 [Monosporascus sp. CRB-8-3]|nr:hypothetical protein DL769_005297 [Monosporascus sp. CRB-8-3]
MLRFIKKYLTFALITTPAVRAAAVFNATDTLNVSQLATSTMTSATSTAKSSLGLSYVTVEAKAEVSTSLDTAGQLNATVTCDDSTLQASLGHKLLRPRFPKKKGGHSKSDGGDEDSSVCHGEESTDHLPTAAIAGIIVGCIIGATIMVTAIAIVIRLWRDDKSSVDVEKASGNASAATQIPSLFLTGAAAFNSTHSVEIRQKVASPTISTVAPTEISVSPSMETITASLKVYSASERRRRSRDEEKDSSFQESRVSAELPTAVIAGIIVGCILGAAILISIIALVIILRYRKPNNLNGAAAWVAENNLLKSRVTVDARLKITRDRDSPSSAVPTRHRVRNHGGDNVADPAVRVRGEKEEEVKLDVQIVED